jgi:hypothetical protein
MLSMDGTTPPDGYLDAAPSPVAQNPYEAPDAGPAESGPSALERRNVRYYLSGLALIGAAGSTTVILAPIIGVVTLGATTSQVGVITLIYLVLSVSLQVPFASWADRRRDHLRILPLTCLLSAVVAALIPLLYLVGRLSIGTLYLAVALLSLLSVFRGSLGHSIVNQLAPPHRRGAIVGRLNGISGGVDTVSQSVSSGLVSLVPAPIAMLAATVATLLAPGLLTKVRLPAADPPAAGPSGGSSSTAAAAESPRAPRDSSEAGHESYRLIVGRLARMPALWILTAFGFVNSLVEPVLIPFVLRDLRVPAGLVGLLLATGALGGIVGGYLISRLVTGLGLRASLAVATATSSAGILSLLVAPPGPVAAACIVCYELLTAFGGTIVVAAVFGQLQQDCGVSTVARTLASANTVLQVAGILGVTAGIAVSLALPARANVAMYLAGSLLITSYLIVGKPWTWQASRTPVSHGQA